MKTYANKNEIVTAEQFTDDHMPECVELATKEYAKKVLVPSIYKKIKGEKLYRYVYPRPAQFQREVGRYFGEDHPSAWIKKGDYIIHYKKWDEVESKENFERSYKQVQIVEP